MGQLERGTTRQTNGLELEQKLVPRLQREFPKDKIEHKGQGGDILHLVKFNGQIAGTIIYECKRCPRINSAHVQQAYEAKLTRKAHFAVLVTTGQRKGFSGLCQTSGGTAGLRLVGVSMAALVHYHLMHCTQPKRS